MYGSSSNKMKWLSKKPATLHYMNINTFSVNIRVKHFISSNLESKSFCSFVQLTTSDLLSYMTLYGMMNNSYQFVSASDMDT